MASLPTKPSLTSPAGEPTIFRQQRQWGAQLQEVVAQHEAAFQGRYLPQGRLPGVATARPSPHMCAKYDGTTVQVGIGRAYAAPEPEFVFVNYRGALVEIAMTLAENVATSASGYIVYEVTCAASVWAATAVFVADITTLADTGKIYIPVAKVVYYGASIQTIYQLLYENPVVEVGSPQYSITVDAANGRLQFLNDQSVPPPMSIYATDQNGVKGWHALCPLVDACAGGDPEEGQPCGDCAALPSCYDVASYAADMFDPTGCDVLDVTGTAWDGKLAKTSSATQPCAYTGDIILTNPNDASEFLASYSLVQYLDGVTCTWRLTFLTRGFDEPSIIWQGEHTSTDPDDAAFTRVAGCDSTATVSLTQCLRTIRLTVSGMVRCCSSSAYKPDSVAMLNGTWDIVEDGPGAGTWTLAFGAFEAWNLETWDGAACTGSVTASVAQDLNVQVTYDGNTTWHIDGANDGFNSVFWIYGDDTGGDATGGTMVSTYACGDGGDTVLAAGGTATVEVL